MSEIERYKKLFLRSAFAGSSSTIRKWITHVCPIVILDGISGPAYRHGIALPPGWFMQLSHKVVWPYCSFTAFCGIQFKQIMNVTYNDEERIVITIKDRAISPVIEPALKIRVTSAGRVESVVYVLDIASSLNQSAGAIAESLGFQAWPDIPILEFRSEDSFRPSYDAAVLIGALYSPTTQAGSTAAELMPLLDIILTEAMERADGNREFFDFEQYRSTQNAGSSSRGARYAK